MTYEATAKLSCDLQTCGTKAIKNKIMTEGHFHNLLLNLFSDSCKADVKFGNPICLGGACKFIAI